MFAGVDLAEASNAAMYAGLAVAVVIFIVVCIFIVCLLRRRVPRFIGQPAILTYLLVYLFNDLCGSIAQWSVLR